MCWAAGRGGKAAKTKSYSRTESSDDDLDHTYASEKSMKDEDRDDSTMNLTEEAPGTGKESLKQDEDFGLPETAKYKRRRKPMYDDEGDGDEVNDLLALWTTVQPEVSEEDNDKENGL